MQVVRHCAPLLVHTSFCLLSAALLRYALARDSYAVLGCLPLVFLAVVAPTLLFGWPPWFGYPLEPLARSRRQRVLLASFGGLLVAYAVFSSVTFDSVLLGAMADSTAFAVGATLLYVAHKDGKRAPPMA